QPAARRYRAYPAGRDRQCNGRATRRHAHPGRRQLPPEPAEPRPGDDARGSGLDRDRRAVAEAIPERTHATGSANAGPVARSARTFVTVCTSIRCDRPDRAWHRRGAAARLLTHAAPIALTPDPRRRARRARAPFRLRRLPRWADRRDRVRSVRP